MGLGGGEGDDMKKRTLECEERCHVTWSMRSRAMIEGLVDTRGGITKVVTPSGRHGEVWGGGGAVKVLSWIEVERETLKSNVEATRKLLKDNVRLCAVIKGNAYGHSLIPAAKALEEAGVDYLGVDSLEEGVALRHAGIQIPISILYWSDPWAAPLMARHHLQPTAWELGWVAAAATALAAESSLPPVEVHVHVDTGLGREGCTPEEALRVGAAVQELSSLGMGLRLQGVATHLCCPRNKDATNQHVQSAASVHAALAPRQSPPPLLHVASAAPAITLPSSQGDMVRIGGLLFGILPGVSGITQEFVRVRAAPARAMRWLTVVTNVKAIAPGGCVGYECAVPAPAQGGLVAMLPLGSHDGFLDPPSSFRSVLIRGSLCAVLSVDANLALVDVASAPLVMVGDVAVILGCDAVNASLCVFPTLSTRIPTHLPRVYV